MKCEKCGKEASFHYQSDINNVKTEVHLCSECSQAEGYGEFFQQAMRPMFSGLWGMPFNLTGGLSSPPFPALGAMFSPVVAFPFFSTLPSSPEVSTGVEEKKADNVPKDAGEEIRARREIAALRHQLQNAVMAEEYEKAAQLRDKIREMER